MFSASGFVVNLRKLYLDMKNRTIKDRLALFLHQIGASTGDFGYKCGLSSSAVATLSEKSSAQTFNKIFAAFPQLSPIWLQTGEGEMFRTVAMSRTTYEEAKNGLGNPPEDDYLIIQQKRIKSIIADILESRSVVEKQIEHYGELISAKDDQISRLLAMLEEKDKMIAKLVEKL